MCIVLECRFQNFKYDGKLLNKQKRTKKKKMRNTETKILQRAKQHFKFKLIVFMSSTGWMTICHANEIVCFLSLPNSSLLFIPFFFLFIWIFVAAAAAFVV